jgi:DNA-binding transcriptional LysR family regulator
MDLKVIHYFIGVYEERNFTRAAERLHVVQPALSIQIRHLEDELGTPLFERNSRGVEPTAAGHRFYELCVPISHSVAIAKQEIADLVEGDKVGGSLRIGMPPSVCHGIMGTVLEQFTTHHPNVDLTLLETSSANVTRGVEQGELDFGLGAVPTEPTSLVARPTFEDSFALVSGQPIHGASFTLCDMTSPPPLKLVLPTRNHLIGTMLLDQVLNGEIVPRQMMKVEGLISSLEVAANSDWAAVVPAIALVKLLHDDKFFIYPIVKPRLRLNLYLIYDPRRPLTPAARRFVAIVETELERARTLWQRASTQPGIETG